MIRNLIFLLLITSSLGQKSSKSGKSMSPKGTTTISSTTTISTFTTITTQSLNNIQNVSNNLSNNDNSKRLSTARIVIIIIAILSLFIFIIIYRKINKRRRMETIDYLEPVTHNVEYQFPNELYNNIMTTNKIIIDEYDQSNNPSNNEYNDIVVNNYDIASNNHIYQEPYNI